MAEHGGHGGGGEGGGILREILAIFGFEVETGELEEGKSKLEQFAHKVTEIVEGLAAALGVEKVVEFAEANVRAMTDIEHASQRLGISTEAVQQFQFAAKSMGMEAESLLNMMGRMQVAQQGAIQGTGPGAEAFKALGVAVKDSTGHARAADEVFLDLADGFKKIDDPAKRAALATQIFGRQGRELLPFLVEGREGVKDLKDAFKELGGGFSEEAMRRGKAFEKTSARLGLAWKSLKSVIVEGLLPPLTWLFEKITQGVSWLRKAAEGTRIVEVSLALLGAAALAFAAPMLIAAAPIMAFVVALGLVAMFVEDIVALFEGKQSIIGDAIDAIFGKDAHVDVVNSIRDAWHAISDWIKEAWTTFKPFRDAIFAVADKMGEIMAGMLSIGNKLKGKLVGAEPETKEQGEQRRAATKVLNAIQSGKPIASLGMSQEDLTLAYQTLQGVGAQGPVVTTGPQTYGPTIAPQASQSSVGVDVTISATSDFHAKVRKTMRSQRNADKRAAMNTLPRAPQE